MTPLIRINFPAIDDWTFHFVGTLKWSLRHFEGTACQPSEFKDRYHTKNCSHL